MAKKDAPEKQKKEGRLKQIALVYRMTKKSDPRIPLILLGVFLVVGAIAFGIFTLVPGSWILDVITSTLIGLLAVMIVFGRRAQKAAYGQMEGQPGAAAAALRMLRRGWKSEPVIAFTKQQDVVHRVVGPPGIVLVGEGNAHRLRQLMTSERRKHERVAAGVPIHEVICGNEPGQVPLPKLARHIQKLGRSVKPAEMTDILNRLKALDANRPAIPMPKGPVPTSMKGMRQNMRGR